MRQMIKLFAEKHRKNQTNVAIAPNYNDDDDYKTMVKL